MAAAECRPPEPGADDDNSIHVSLIDAIQNFTDLDVSLSKLERFLQVLGFCQYSIFSAALSWLAFVVFSIVVPLFVTHFGHCSNCELYQINDFEHEVFVCQAVTAFVSLLCISHNLRKYRIRKLLFVDRYHGQLTQFSELYLKKIRVSVQSHINYLWFMFISYSFVLIVLQNQTSYASEVQLGIIQSAITPFFSSLGMSDFGELVAFRSFIIWWFRG